MENDTMRITIDKWNKGMKRTFEYNEMSKMMVNESHTMALVPFSDEAKTHLLLTEGIVLDEDGVQLSMLNNTTNKPIGSIGCTMARLKNNSADLIRIGDSSFDPKLLRKVLTNYNRQNDALHIFGSDGEDYPIKILTPCLDWFVYIAPRVQGDDDESTRLHLLPFDYGVLA